MTSWNYACAGSLIDWGGGLVVSSVGVAKKMQQVVEGSVNCIWLGGKSLQGTVV